MTESVCGRNKHFLMLRPSVRHLTVDMLLSLASSIEVFWAFDAFTNLNVRELVFFIGNCFKVIS